MVGVVERQVNGKWICVNTLSNARTGPAWDDWHKPRCLERDYERFDALTAAAGTRGLPEDASETVRLIALHYRDGVRHSWLPLPDAAHIMLETERDAMARACASQDPCDYYFNEMADDAGDCRFVFWFDQ